MAVRHRVAGCLSIAAGMVLLFGGTTAWGQEVSPVPEPIACAATGCDPASEASSKGSADAKDHTGPVHTQVAAQPTSTPAAQPRLGVATAGPAPGARAVRTAQADSASVDIGDNFFAPKELTITVGTTVTWTNKGQNPHTSTADDGSWDSGEDPPDYILPGERFSHTFAAAGRFPYYCRLHGEHGGVGQAGVITVTAEDRGGQPETTTRDAEVEGTTPRAAGPGVAETSNGALAATGPEHLFLGSVGLTLIAAGGVLLLVARRRPA